MALFSPKERIQFDFERLNRAARRALGARARKAGRSPLEQWFAEHPYVNEPSPRSQTVIVPIPESQVISTRTVEPPSLTTPTAPITSPYAITIPGAERRSHGGK
jgi:hypothetical protein